MTDPTDAAFEKARNDPKVQRRIEDVKAVEGLKEHPGFQYLRGRLEEHKEELALAMARRLWEGKEVPREEVAHARGFFDGAMFVLSFPEQAGERLEEVVENAWTRLNVEAETTDESPPSPYL
jgi:hypothetical protein